VMGGYDSGMKRRTKREISRLARGVKDPRRGFSTAHGYVRKIVGILLQLDAFGFVLVILLAAPISFPLGYLGGLMAGFKGQVIGAVVGMLIFVVWVFRANVIMEQVKAAGKEHDFELCLWCHFPIVGFPNRSRCPECGKGFDRAISQKLYKQQYEPRPYQPVRSVVLARSARLWARAIRERDRVRDE